jgi:hypothetical protein
MCFHDIGGECTKSMSPVNSKRGCATSHHMFRPATPIRRPRPRSAQGPNFFTSLFYPTIHIQLIAAQRLNPTSLLSERTQIPSPTSSPRDRAGHNFFRFRVFPEIRPQPLAAHRLNPTSPQSERTQILRRLRAQGSRRPQLFSISVRPRISPTTHCRTTLWPASCLNERTPRSSTSPSVHATARIGRSAEMLHHRSSTPTTIDSWCLK